MGFDRQTSVCFAVSICVLTWLYFRTSSIVAKLRRQLAEKEAEASIVKREVENAEIIIKESNDRLSHAETELKKVKKAYTECKNAYDANVEELETANFPIFGIDRHRKINNWNLKATEITGYSKEEALGNDIMSMIIEEHRQVVSQTFDKLLEETEKTGEQSHRNLEFTMVTSKNQRLTILLNATTRTIASLDEEASTNDRQISLLCVAQDITEQQLEARRRLNYLDVCGAAVWSLKARFVDSKVDLSAGEIEQLISQRAQTDLWDPRMVLWRASFGSIVTIMCRTMWEERKASATDDESNAAGSFSYEFSFEATNGQVKWYKVEGHEDLEAVRCYSEDYDFEATGYVQEVTLMYIEKSTVDRWQKWWSRMCHMVFDATLLVDTQEYRVLNAWGEEKVFGNKIQCPNQPILHLIRPLDTDSMKEALNEVTCTGFRPGRSLRLVRPTDKMEIPAQCFFLSADPENPNECMVGIRLSAITNDEQCMWNVSPCRFLTLEDLSRVARVAPQSLCRARSQRHRHHRKNGVRKRDLGGGSSTSLTSIPEDLLEDAHHQELAGSSEASSCSNDTTSRDAMANASIDARSLPSLQERLKYLSAKEFGCSNYAMQNGDSVKPPRPLEHCSLKWARKTFRIALLEVETFDLLLEKVQELIGTPMEGRMRLVMNGRQIKYANNWAEVWQNRNAFKKISLMVIGSPKSPAGKVRSKNGGSPEEDDDEDESDDATKLYANGKRLGETATELVLGPSPLTSSPSSPDEGGRP